MNRFHGRSFVAVALMLTASCDNPTGVKPDPDPIVQPDDVTVVVKLRVIPSQEARSRPHFADLQIRIGNEVYSATADGTIKIVRSKNDPAAVLRVEMKSGAPFFFKEAETLPVKLASGTLYWDVLPVEYVVADGQFVGQSGPIRVKENCELGQGEYGHNQDFTFYPALFCEDSPAMSMPIVYKFPVKLNRDTGSVVENEWLDVWRRVQEHMSEFGAGIEWFAPGDGAVKVSMHSSPGPCTAIPRIVVNGEVKEGEWRCPVASPEHFPGSPRNHLLNESADHEIVHLLGLGHKCDAPTRMAAPGCNRPDGHNGVNPTWPEQYTLQDVIDIRVWLESQVLAHSEAKSDFGMKEVLREELT